MTRTLLSYSTEPEQEYSEWFENIEKMFLRLGCITCIDRKPDKKGYGVFTRNRKSLLTHREVYGVFFQKSIDGKIVRHICDNPACMNPFHLKLGTHNDNVQDRVKRNRSAIGENHGRAKLDNEKVRYIKDHPEIGIKKFAKMYGVDKMVISRIRNGKYWKHIQYDKTW